MDDLIELYERKLQIEGMIAERVKQFAKLHMAIATTPLQDLSAR